jgi:hypothetical protein
MAALSNEAKYRGLLRDLNKATNELTELKNIANSKMNQIQSTTAFSDNMMLIDAKRYQIRLIRDKLSKFNRNFVESLRKSRSRSPNGTRGRRRSRSQNRGTRRSRS